jgi:hypothetical protein
MVKQRDTVGGSPCVLCGSPSSKNGEHVWPSWFLKTFEAQGPFYTEVNGEPQKKKDGTVRKFTALQGTRVPMCANGCNSVLNDRFEVPVKDVVRAAKSRNADERWGALTVEEVRSLVLWVLKVGLLSKHPAAVFDDPAMNGQVHLWDDADPVLYGWMRNGSPPPEGLTVLVGFESRDVDENPVGTYFIPTEFVTSEGTFTARVVLFGVLDLSFTVLFHPQQTFDYAALTAQRSSSPSMQMVPCCKV